MKAENADKFWQRYDGLVSKDVSAQVKKNVKQPTLFTWKKRNIFPRANDACAIAKALNTTVEFLVTGEDTALPGYSPDVVEIAVSSAKLDDDGLYIAREVIDSLRYKHSTVNPIYVRQKKNEE